VAFLAGSAFVRAGGQIDVEGRPLLQLLPVQSPSMPVMRLLAILLAASSSLRFRCKLQVPSRLLAHHLLAPFGIQARRLAHVGIDLAGGEVVMGLAHHRIGRIAGSVQALVALVRKAQALFGCVGCLGFTGRMGRLADLSGQLGLAIARRLRLCGCRGLGCGWGLVFQGVFLSFAGLRRRRLGHGLLALSQPPWDHAESAGTKRCLAHERRSQARRLPCAGVRKMATGHWRDVRKARSPRSYGTWPQARTPAARHGDHDRHHFQLPRSTFHDAIESRKP
jgi:hypothetical protein